ncbi:MAG: uroporphyrinogen decarboxylase [Pseudomonadota bacterium]
MGENRQVWFMRQAGRYLPEYRKVRKRAGGFLNLCFSPDMACEVTLQPIRRFDFSHAIIFSDILTVPHALGYDVTIDEHKGGPLVETLYKPDDVFSLEDYDRSIVQPVLEAITLTRKALPKEKKLIGFCGAPWTLAVYMLQGRSQLHNQETFLFAHRNPEAFAALIAHLTAQIISYLGQQIEAGCDTIQIFDSWASFLSPELFTDYVLKPHYQIFSSLKAQYPNVTLVGFPRGAGGAYKDYARESGCDVMGCDQSVSINDMQAFQKNCAVQGNLDPFLLLAGGDKLISKTLELKRLYETGPYIFNLGHGVLPQTPIAHISQTLSTLHQT